MARHPDRVEVEAARLRRRMVEEQVRARGIRDEGILAAMRSVPRHRFVPGASLEAAYADAPQPIGSGQTISQPYIVARLVQLAGVGPGDRVLDVGTGSGYQAAVLAEIVAPSDAPREVWGHVWTIERVPELAEFARRNLERTGYSDRVTVVVGDGTLGLPEHAPYDRILVTAGAPTVPEPLVEQLAAPGRMVIPVGDYLDQYLVVVEKDEEGRVEMRRDLPVRFVPLIGRYGWRG